MHSPALSAEVTGVGDIKGVQAVWHLIADIEGSVQCNDGIESIELDGPLP